MDRAPQRSYSNPVSKPNSTAYITPTTIAPEYHTVLPAPQSDTQIYVDYLPRAGHSHELSHGEALAGAPEPHHGRRVE